MGEYILILRALMKPARWSLTYIEIPVQFKPQMKDCIQKLFKPQMKDCTQKLCSACLNREKDVLCEAYMRLLSLCFIGLSRSTS